MIFLTYSIDIFFTEGNIGCHNPLFVWEGYAQWDEDFIDKHYNKEDHSEAHQTQEQQQIQLLMDDNFKQFVAIT